MTADEKQGRRLAFLGALAGGLAHEIKNPLSTLAMNLQLLREDWQHPESEREARLLRKLDILSREVKRLEAILDDFLRFAGDRKLEKGPVQIAEIVENVLEFLSPRFVEGDVKVTTMFAEGLPELRGDPDAMKQVFMNLVLNALQAMPEGGELMIRSRATGKGVVVEITDTGEGIPQELIQKVFQVYYSRRRTGTGMGLPTALRLVEEHDGTMDVVSEVGKGTRFTITLPVPGGEQ